ncbi:ATP-binding protein [Actinokineospora auranticolor]|uniref:ATP-binding protein n=1 Tax=Actinokineospora auranticolor TaxID=155976 RepID=UPI001FE6F173|nr:ATP-binding protein [Actinokineospora auranticolor]
MSEAANDGRVRHEAENGGRVRQLATRLPSASRSAGEAREFVGAALRSWGVVETLVCDVILAASELVTNAIEHGVGEIRVELSLVAPRVRLRVWDDTREVPVRKPPSLLSERSRGLTIVDALSHAWGHEADGVGKWVWADFAVPAGSGVGGRMVEPVARHRESAK